MQEKLEKEFWNKSVPIGFAEFARIIWQYRLWSFKGRDTKLERLLTKKSTVVK
jgi:hypothetical protein